MQNREPPAYMEYPGSILTRIDFRMMTLSARGLLYTLRLELWINKKLPRNAEKLAKVLGFDAGEVAAALPAVMPFLDVQDDCIVCPELLDYRAHIDNQRERMASGGKKGAAATNSKRKRPVRPVDIGDSTTPTTTPTMTTQPPRRGASEVLVQSSTEKPSQDQSPEKEVTRDPWLAEYEAAESCTADAYARASGGG